MHSLELINKINKYSIDNKENELLNILNDLFNDGSYKSFLQETFSLISITEMYGFLAYLTPAELNDFLNWDELKSKTYKGINIKFYNRGQLSLLYDFDKNRKVFLSAPTSFGKTSIVLEYIIDNYQKLNNILFVVPTNSLLEELYQKITLLNKQISMNYFISTQPHIKKNNRNFLLLTPERFFLISEIFNIDIFDLTIMDETYKIVDSKKDHISDFLDSRALRFRKVADMIGNSNKRVIFLSPFTYTLSSSMELFLKKYNIKKIDRKLEYVSRKIYKIVDAKDFTDVFGKNEKYIKNLSKAKKTKYILEKLEKQKNIVYVSNYSEAYKIVDEINEIKQISYSERFEKFIKHLKVNYITNTGYEWKIITALKKGIGIYVAPLPRYIKKEIVNLYNKDELKTLIVTTAFTEGVNTNASNLIFTSLNNGPTTNKLSEIDILNVSGRAGRFAKSSIGNIYCIDDNVYEKVSLLQQSGTVMLENYNYSIGNSEINRTDYEIEMIDDEFLTQKESNIKKEIDEERKKLNLTKKELNISLCVPTKWKLIIYQGINNNNIEELYNACKNVLSNESDKRVESLKLIFLFIKGEFDKFNIDPFQCKSYEIKAFDNSNNFIWGRLYSIYSTGKAKDIIDKNIRYISREFNKIKELKNFPSNNKKNAKRFLKSEGKEWILSYYNSELEINYDAFYTETFKFINSIIQYKIPFYVSFVTSIVKLYLEKNALNNTYDIDQLDSKQVTLFFENGSVDDTYEPLLDYGISNDMMIKINDNNISFNDIINLNFNENIFDEYELIILKDFIYIMK